MKHVHRLLSLLLTLALLLGTLSGVQILAADDAAHGTIQISASGGKTTVTVKPDSGYDLCTLHYTSGLEEIYVLPDSWTETSTGYTITLPVSVRKDKVTATFFCTTVWDGSLDVSWYTSTGTSFCLSNPAQLAGLAAIVNGVYNTEITRDMIKGNPTYIVDNYEAGSEDTDSGYGLNQTTPGYHYGADTFNGKTIYLTCDMDMGGVYDADTGAWSGAHNYMPIGGQYRMDLESGDSKVGSAFCGTFDGQGYTVANIYCDRHNNDKYYGDGSSVGLIGRLGVHDNDPVASRPYVPTVRNVVVTGYIYARRSVGGIVGKTGKTAYNNVGSSGSGSIIENCANYATVIGTDAKGTAGIVGAAWNGGIVRNCYNFGTISSSYGGPCGGIVGYNENSIINCYNVGRVTNTAASEYAMAISSDNGGTYVLANNYYLKDTAAGGGYYNAPTAYSGACTAMDAAAMKTEEFVAMLNGDTRAFVYDSTHTNNGYPILRCTLHAGSDELNGFTVATEPRTDYLVGEAVDMEDFVLYANYADGSRERVHSYIVSVGGRTADYANDKTDDPITLMQDMLNEEGRVTLTVSGSYGGKSFSYQYVLTVDTAITPTALSVSGFTCRTYVAGELPDTTGVTVTVFYASTTTGSTGSQIIGDYTLRADQQNTDGTLRSGATELTFSYTIGGVTVSDTASICVLAEEPVKQDGFYLLDSADDLIWFAAQVNERQQTRLCARLRADLDLSQRALTPIGASSKACFAGTIDGNGHTITLGKFQSVSFGSISSSLALCGYTKNATLVNLTIAGTISGSTRIAGFIAQDTGYTTISGCTNKAAITATAGFSGGMTASITGPDCTYADCTNTGVIQASGSTGYGTGGIVGNMATLTSIQLTDASNEAAVTAAGGIAGGIVGALRGTSTVSGCVNNAAVTGYSNVAGIVGQMGDTSAATIEACESYGTVTASNVAAGGIVGSGYGAPTYAIYSCSNHAAIQGKSNVGGIAGQLATTIYYSYNAGTVTATSATSTTGAGGIVGSVTRSTRIWYCYNVGAVTSSKNAGGLAGYAKNYIVFDNSCYLAGTATQAVTASSDTYITTAPTAGVTADYLKSAEAITFLNSNGSSRVYSADTERTNNSYPVHRYTLSSEDAVMTSLQVTSEPLNLTYVEGQSFSTDGLVISALYSDGTREEVDTYTVTPSGPLTLDDQQVTITCEYNGFTCDRTYDITVEAATVRLIRVKASPSRLVYAVGDSFDPTGMVVEAVYTNDTTQTLELADLIWTPSEALTTGTKWVTIQYVCDDGTYEATVTIQVQDSASLTQDADGYYQISNTAELLLFMGMVNEQGMTGINARITADIDATSTSFKPIGTADAPYTGTLLGNGHTVTLKLSGSSVSRGMFDALGTGARIENLTLAGSVSGKENVGALAAQAIGAIIVSCKNTATVSGATNVGGLVGYAMDCTISGCENSGALSATGSCMGGIAGLASGTDFANCTNTVTITAIGKSNVAGIAGLCYACSFTDCANTAELKVGGHSGGIAGGADYGQSGFLRCTNTGAITASGFERIGGIVGSVGNDGAASAQLTSCINTGAVTGAKYTGGIVGCATTTAAAPTVFACCGNTGAITSSSSYAGGIAGSAQGTMDACYSSADITAQSDVGGIAGHANGLVLTDCYATGTVQAQAATPGAGTGLGGLLGVSEGSEELTNCYSAATLQASGSISTGLVGYTFGALHVENVYADTAVVGGIYGEGSASGEITALTDLAAMQLGLRFMPAPNGGTPQLCWQNDHTHSFTGSVNGTVITHSCTCGYSYTTYSDCTHQWQESDRIPSTCTTAGSVTYTCTACSASYSEALPLADCPSVQFTDAPSASDWAHAGIDYCVSNGLMNGFPDNTFLPDNTLTRAQLVTILYREAGSPAVEYDGSFTDVSARDWFVSAVAWAAENGIVTGFPNGTFKPNQAITREQIATILYRVVGEPDVAPALAGFPDVNDAHSYATDALSWAVTEGLINGIGVQGTSYLKPLNTATRAQIATIMMRYLTQ